MIVDNLRVHHAKKVKSLGRENKDKNKTILSTTILSEFNPDEYLNQDYKSNVHKNRCKESKELKKYKIMEVTKIHKSYLVVLHPSVKYWIDKINSGTLRILHLLLLYMNQIFSNQNFGKIWLK